MAMKLQHIAEPRLVFARGEHICPRHGIATCGVYDARDSTVRRDRVFLGAVGDSKSLEALAAWVARCAEPIARNAEARQPHLFTDFCGVRKGVGFDSQLVFHEELSRPLRNIDVDGVVKESTFKARVEKAVELYYENIRFLAENRHVDVIVCVLPERLHTAVASEREGDAEETLEASHDVTGEMNFRRALKAKAMHLAKPLQLVREVSLMPGAKGQQDDATKAWNFATALYYKSGPTVPWKLTQSPARLTCAVGIAFYRSRDYQSVNTSLAQIFDELGHGLILRGTPVDFSKDDRTPRLTADQAKQLLERALGEYRLAMKTAPARVVLHKSSNFAPEEMEGFDDAAQSLNIHTVDYVTLLDSRLRVYRNGQYPPYRGSFFSLDEKTHVLYSRGSVWFYETYPGKYVPAPVEVRIIRSDETPMALATEILGLTKMNWNNTQFDGKYPVTLGCARKVGEILKYLPDHEQIQNRYSFYM
jgi:hypothetical protein